MESISFFLNSLDHYYNSPEVNELDCTDLEKDIIAIYMVTFKK